MSVGAGFMKGKNEMIKLIKKLIGLFFGRGENGLWYINGAKTLPAPLSPEEEAEALSQAESDPSRRSVLIEHNLRLVVYIAKKFENTGIGIEDLISIGTIGLIKAVNTFKSDKNIKLATYASRCIENEILMYIRREQNRRGELSIDEPLNIDWDGNELLLSDVLGSDEDMVYRNLESDDDRATIMEAISSLGEREREIVSLRFAIGGGKEYTQKEVADMLGISQSYISRLEKKIISKLKSRIETKI